MAINKRKVLQSAQKHLQKGALDKALRDYEKLLQADPKDTNIRLKVGDVHLKQGKTDEAVTAYLKVAERFGEDGFDAKAVALYKQILKIDPKRLELHEPLAELYERLGLAKDALASLETAAEAFHQEGDKNRALAVLRRMAEIDPSNTTHRLKVAELLVAEGLTEDAVAEFEAAAAEFGRVGDEEGRSKAIRRVMELGSREQHIGDLARSYLAQGKYADAATLLEEHIAGPADADIPAHEALAEAYREMGRDSELNPLYKRIAELHRARGNEAEARDVMQRLVDAGELVVEPTNAEQDLIELDDPTHHTDVFSMGDEMPVVTAAETDPSAAIEETPFELSFEDDAEELEIPSIELTADEADSQELAFSAAEETQVDPLTAEEFDPDPLSAEVEAEPSAQEIELDARPQSEEIDFDLDATSDALELPVEAPETTVGSDAPSLVDQPVAVGGSDDVEGDPAQLLAEAAVYLRYGKRDRAIASLQAILKQDPEHREALSKLGECLEDAGENVDAAKSYARAAALYRDAGHDRVFGVLRDKVCRLDPEQGRLLEAADADDPLPGGSDEIESPAADAPEEDLSGSFELPEDDDGAAVGAEAQEEASSFEFDAPEEAPPSVEFEMPEEAPSVEFEAPESEPSIELEIPNFDEATDVTDDVDEAESVAFTDEPSVEVEAPSLNDAIDEEEIRDAGSDDFPDIDGDLAASDDFNLADLEASLSSEELDEALDADANAPLPEDSDFGSTISSLDQASDTASIEPGQLADELEEADFFFQQEMWSEAEAAYRRILDVIPHQPQALVRLGELEARSGSDEGAISAELDIAAEPAPDPAEVDALEASGRVSPLEEPVDDDHTATLTPDLTDPSNDTQSLGESQGALDFEEPSEALSFDADDTSELTAALAAAAAEQTDVPDLDAADAMSADDPGTTPAEFLLADDDNGADAEGFDLAAELNFDEPAETPQVVTDREAPAFEQVFADFKRHIEREVDAGDSATHFDLGIAYREMGLFEDALAEFRVAQADEGRQLECLHMMGLCAVALERHEDGMAHFEQALSFPELPADQIAALRYDLADACQAAGDLERSLAFFRQVAEEVPDFRDVSERIARIESGDVQPEGSAAGETFESFDDLIEEVQGQDMEAAPAESFESFDDLAEEVEPFTEEPPFTDADEDMLAQEAQLLDDDPEPFGAEAPAVLEDDEIAPTGEEEFVVEAEEEAEITAPDAPEPEGASPETAEPEDDTPRSKRRKRKISFV